MNSASNTASRDRHAGSSTVLQFDHLVARLLPSGKARRDRAGHSVLNAETEGKKILRLQLSQLTAQTIKTAMHLLGIQVPERM